MFSWHGYGPLRGL